MQLAHTRLRHDRRWRALAAAGTLAGALACGGGSTSPNTVASITLAPDTDSVAVGGTTALSATVYGPGGSPLSGQRVFWNTENPAVATVSDDGVVTGVAPGSTRIAASAAGASGFAAITVLPPPVAVVVVTPPADTLLQRATVQLTATLLDGAGHPLGGRTVAWSSSDPQVAAVSAGGVVTAALGGTATITATSEGKTGTASVVVLLPPVASLTITPNPDLISVGQQDTLTAVARDASGAVITGAPVTWGSNNENAAVVSDAGVVRGVRIGIATIAARSGTATATTTVIVQP